MKRKIYGELKKWKEKGMKKPLMIIGARQVGKTYIIRKFCEKEYPQYVYINLFENEDIVKLFAKEISMLEKVRTFKIMIKDSQGIDIDFEKTIIFFDEVQESEEIISSLKYFNESEVGYKIICAGSLLGVKLKRMKKSFPVGKVDMINMYPMDFEEFLMATLGNDIIDIIGEHYTNNEPIIEELHYKLMSLYRLYLCVGGMPEAVEDLINNDKDILKIDRSIVKNILNGYFNDMKKYVKDATESVRIEQIYRSIPSQIGNVSNKFQYSSIRTGARSKNYETALQWLLSSSLINKVCMLKSPQIPPNAYKDEEVFKLYLGDVGILNSLLNINFEDIILDKDFIYKGEITKNYINQQLNINFEDIYYWKSHNTAEVDFLIYNKDGIIPIEVKAGDGVQSKSLKVYMQRYNAKYGIKICAKNFGYANNIKTIPLYAAFLIK